MSDLGRETLALLTSGGFAAGLLLGLPLGMLVYCRLDDLARQRRRGR